MKDDVRVALDDATRHWREVFGLALVLIRDRCRAEELAQEAYLRLTGSAERLDVSRPLRPILLTIVRRLAWNDRRRRPPERLEGEVLPDERGASPLESLAERERRGAVRDALFGLRPAWRETVFLRDGLDLSYREIAGVLETSEDVVRTTLHRARAKVRELLGPRLQPEER